MYLSGLSEHLSNAVDFLCRTTSCRIVFYHCYFHVTATFVCIFLELQNVGESFSRAVARKGPLRQMQNAYGWDWITLQSKRFIWRVVNFFFVGNSYIPDEAMSRNMPNTYLIQYFFSRDERITDTKGMRNRKEKKKKKKKLKREKLITLMSTACQYEHLRAPVAKGPLCH